MKTVILCCVFVAIGFFCSKYYLDNNKQKIVKSEKEKYDSIYSVFNTYKKECGYIDSMQKEQISEQDKQLTWCDQSTRYWGNHYQVMLKKLDSCSRNCQNYRVITVFH